MTYEDIAHAFPPGAPWTDPVPGCPPEIFQIERDLRGRSWLELTTAMCNRHSDAYHMLDLEPLAYFLPAFLRAAVSDPNGVAAESLVYFVCSGKARKARDLYLRLTGEQRDVMMGVVALLLKNGDDSFVSGERVKFAARLREWSARKGT